MNGLEEAREIISRVDGEMAALFEERMKAVAAVAAYKKENGLPVLDPAREEAVLALGRKRISDPVIEEYYSEFLKNTMAVSRAYQASLISGRSVAFCGVPGAYAHIAARKLYPEGRFTGFSDFARTYAAAEEGECDCAVLPLGNSTAGEVPEVMDLLFAGSLYINRLIDLPVRHGLLACPGASLGGIRKVFSHPQALRQCAGYLRSRGWETVETGNTAEAAKRVREMNDPSLAAIASEEAADLYGLRLLEGGINDEAGNTTRFAALTRSLHMPEHRGLREDAGFILMFTVQNRAGALAQTLNIIGAHGYNMKTLRSRPMKGLQWNYYFYVEAEGNINSENGEMLLRELGAVCARLKLVGVW